jgi:hypothetical protein
LATVLAIRTGVPAREWLEDTNALVTAVDLLHEADQKR